MKLFRWGLLFRYVLYGVFPLLMVFWLLDRAIGSAGLGNGLLLLAVLLPVIAIGWLAYQHWRYRGR
jgi:hypothetical protein